MANGILIVDKPSDWTSNDVVIKLKGLLHERRIGHAGTLDPMATGVLPVFVGRATRAVEFAAEAPKEYVATLELGRTTDTQDSTGKTLTSSVVDVDRNTLEQALSGFRGDILQVPPMYSALKIQGKRLYDLARKGKEVERKPRSITIYELELLQQIDEVHWTLRILCSKGTYIRTLCHDIGARLGVGGIMSSLRRTQAAGFTLEHALTIEQIVEASKNGNEGELLLPVDTYFRQYPDMNISGRQERLCRNGNEFACNTADGKYRVYGESGEFLMLGQCDSGKMKTIKSFFGV